MIFHLEGWEIGGDAFAILARENRVKWSWQEQPVVANIQLVGINRHKVSWIRGGRHAHLEW